MCRTEVEKAEIWETLRKTAVTNPELIRLSYGAFVVYAPLMLAALARVWLPATVAQPVFAALVLAAIVYRVLIEIAYKDARVYIALGRYHAAQTAQKPVTGRRDRMGDLLSPATAVIVLAGHYSLYAPWWVALALALLGVTHFCFEFTRVVLPTGVLHHRPEAPRRAAPKAPATLPRGRRGA